MASRIEQSIKRGAGEGERKMKERETKRVKKTKRRVKMAGLCREEKLGEGKESSGAGED